MYLVRTIRVNNRESESLKGYEPYSSWSFINHNCYLLVKKQPIRLLLACRLRKKPRKRFAYNGDIQRSRSYLQLLAAIIHR